MSRSFAKASGSARVAVLGSSSECGVRLRRALAEFGLPGSRVDLYGGDDDDPESILTEYDGEARLIQKADFDEIASREVVFLCESSELAERLAEEAGQSTLVVDLVGDRANGNPSRVCHVEINPQVAHEHRGPLTVPHDLSTMVLDVLLPLEREFGCEDVVGVVLRPAGDFGEPGVEELRQQTVQLLNFGGPPCEVFGRQLAFNLLPQTLLPDGRGRLERRIASELTGLLQWSRPRIALSLIAAPVFYGHTLQLRMRCRREATDEQLQKILEREGWDTPGEGRTRMTPLDVAAERESGFVEVRPDGLGGFWLWTVAGEAHAQSAELAVRLAAEVFDL